jgi:hypothetical protein
LGVNHLFDKLVSCSSSDFKVADTLGTSSPGTAPTTVLKGAAECLAIPCELRVCDRGFRINCTLRDLRAKYLL